MLVFSDLFLFLAPKVTTILEQTHLEEFIQSTQLARSEYDAVRPESVEQSMVIIGATTKAKAQRSKYEIQESASRILRRPDWTSSMTAAQIHSAEDQAFLDWRRNLSNI